MHFGLTKLKINGTATANALNSFIPFDYNSIHVRISQNKTNAATIDNIQRGTKCIGFIPVRYNKTETIIILCRNEAAEKNAMAAKKS